MTPWAAKLTACCPEPHWRSTVTAGTDSGKPAESTAWRAMLEDCWSCCSTQPAITSSIADGSTPLRSTRYLRVQPSRSAGCHWLSTPPRLPTGVLTASTMTASRLIICYSGGRDLDFGQRNIVFATDRFPVACRPSFESGLELLNRTTDML